MGLLSRIFGPSSEKSLEGQYRDGPYYLPYSGGWLSAEAGQYQNWWQMGYNVGGSGTSAMLEACVSRYAQTVSTCPGDHWQARGNGGRDRVTNSDLSRIIREPNDYETFSDFLLNLVRGLYIDGNAYALALRNNRFEIDSLHLMHPQMCFPTVSGGEIFYSLGGNEIVSQRITGASNNSLTIPARDVLHIRLHRSNPNSLKGESPIKHAVAMDLATSQAMTAQNLSFYHNQAKPSIALATDEKLTKEQIEALHAALNSQGRGANQGKTAIFTAGLKPVPLSVSAQDSQMVEIMRMSDERVALAYGIPLQVLGLSGKSSGSGAGGATQQYMQEWLNGGLGFALNQVEEGFGRFFQLDGQPDEYMELSTDVLLRSSLKDRVAAYKEAVSGSIMSPDEARAAFELPKTPEGDEPRAQQQLVPLSAAGKIPAAPGPPSQPPAPALPKPEQAPQKDFDIDRARARFRSAQNALGSAA
jgi:HK97 family phage portal protein